MLNYYTVYVQYRISFFLLSFSLFSVSDMLELFKESSKEYFHLRSSLVALE